MFVFRLGFVNSILLLDAMLWHSEIFMIGPMPDNSKHLLIVAHNPSPNTQKLVDATLRGASHADIAVSK